MLPLFALLLGGCSLFRAQHDAPVDPGAVWSGYMGGTERAPFAEEPVSPEAPDILWSSEAGRGLASSPVLSGEVLVASTTGRGIITLSAESGERFWEHLKDGPLTAAPVVDAERIYVSTNDVQGEVYALDRVDGSERWSRRHPGVNAPLLLDGERLYLATRSGYLSALNSETGASIWSVHVGPGATAPVLAGDRVLVGTSRDSLFAVDAESGKIVDRRGLGAQISAAPAEANGMLYLPLQSGELAALRSDDLEEAWRVRVDGPILASPAVSRDGSVYVLDRTGAVHVVDRDGASRRLGAAGGVVTGSLVLARNALVVGRVDGTLLALDRDDGSVLWSLRLGDSIHTPALLRGGVIFVPLRRGKVVKLQ